MGRRAGIEGFKGECVRVKGLRATRLARRRGAQGVGDGGSIWRVRPRRSDYGGGRVKGYAPHDLVGGRAGRVVENLKKKARELGRQWLVGQRKSRGVFRRKAKGGRPAAVTEVSNRKTLEWWRRGAVNHRGIEEV